MIFLLVKLNQCTHLLHITTYIYINCIYSRRQSKALFPSVISLCQCFLSLSTLSTIKWRQSAKKKSKKADLWLSSQAYTADATPACSFSMSVPFLDVILAGNGSTRLWCTQLTALCICLFTLTLFSAAAFPQKLPRWWGTVRSKDKTDSEKQSDITDETRYLSWNRTHVVETG